MERLWRRDGVWFDFGTFCRGLRHSSRTKGRGAIKSLTARARSIAKVISWQ
jgi:hypothetical protein